MSTQTEITSAVVTKLHDTLDAGLTSGIGVRKPGEMCVEATVCYAFGLPHGDNPPCVGSAVRRYKIGLNDSWWSSNKARAEGLRRLAVAQLGSDTLDQVEFARRIALETIRQVLPLALEAAGVDATACRVATTLDEARNAAVTQAAADTATYAAHAARDAAYAAYAATYVASFVSSTYRAAQAATYVAHAAAHDDDAYDAVLVAAAEMAVQVLVEMGSPGAEWLDFDRTVDK